MKYLLAILLFCPFAGQAQIITTIAGDGARGYGGDGGQATVAQLNQPVALTIDDRGNIYIIDVGNDNIREISQAGIITTIAGSRHLDGSFRLPDDGNYGFVKEEIPATASLVWKPHGIVADRDGNVYFTEYENGTIRKISANGMVSTIAGKTKQFAYQLEEGIKAAGNKIGLPNGIAIDNSNNLYYADEHLNVVRKITPAGIITTVAGNGNSGYTGDDDLATRARLNKPLGVAVDGDGNIYIVDNENQRIRKVNSTGIITTIAGTGNKGYDGDDGPATNARLNDPSGIAVDRRGNIYIADTHNDAIRRISASGIISTFAGDHNTVYRALDQHSGDGGPATAAQLHWPYGVAVDTAGNVYIAEDQHHVVRKVSAPPLPPEKKAVQQPEEKMQVKAQEPKEEFTLSVDAEQGLLTIAIDSNAYSSFTITDNKNNILVQQTITHVKTNVDISSLPPALYYVTLKGSNKVKTAGFVKN